MRIDLALNEIRDQIFSLDGRMALVPFRRGLERMADFHDRQDRRYVEAGIEASRKHAKPVLSVTELVASNPENAGPAALREAGRVCYPSAHRAMRALAALVRWSETRASRGE